MPTERTKLSEREELKYQRWRSTIPKNLQYEGDYDLRGFWKENPTWKADDPKVHMGDKYKMSTHPTFSNESKYAVGENKDKAGSWSYEKGKDVFTASNNNLQNKEFFNYLEGENVEVRTKLPVVSDVNRLGTIKRVDPSKDNLPPINYDKVTIDAKAPVYSAEGFPTQKEAIANYIKSNPTKFPKYFKALPEAKQKEAFNEVVRERPNHPMIKALMYEAAFGGAAPVAGLEYVSKIPGVKKALNYIGNKIKPFIPKENVMYRGLGKEGYIDAIESGVFRPHQEGSNILINTETGRSFNIGKKFDKTYYTPYFETADRYGKGYIAEVPNDVSLFSRRYNGSDWSMLTKEQIPIEKGRILKKSWIGEYKEIKPNIKKSISSENIINENLIQNLKRIDKSDGNNIQFEYLNSEDKLIAKFTGNKTNNNIYVNGIEVNPEFRRKGIASSIYEDINKFATNNQGKLHSRTSQHQFTDKDEFGRSIAPATKLWDNLVKKGLAEKYKDGIMFSYKMK